jgi:MerR family mercuric resistance operon transcriptional regulator
LTAAPSEQLAIGALARHTGCSVDTIRYYEHIGLMPEVRRTSGGHRVYDGEHIRRLTFIRRSRMLGMSLDQAREILAGVEHNSYSCRGVKTLLIERAAAIGSKIEELERIQRNLATAIEVCGDAELRNCRIIEAMLAGEDAALDRCCSESSDRTS